MPVVGGLSVTNYHSVVVDTVRPALRTDQGTQIDNVEFGDPGRIVSDCDTYLAGNAGPASIVQRAGVEAIG